MVWHITLTPSIQAWRLATHQGLQDQSCPRAWSKRQERSSGGEELGEVAPGFRLSPRVFIAGVNDSVWKYQEDEGLQLSKQGGLRSRVCKICSG